MTATFVCPNCGHQDHPRLPRQDRRARLTVVDELGSTIVCLTCALFLLAEVESGTLSVTLVVSRPGVSLPC